MIILPDACGFRVLPVPARNAVADSRCADVKTDYGTLCAPRQVLWNNCKLVADPLTKLDKFEQAEPTLFAAGDPDDHVHAADPGAFRRRRKTGQGQVLARNVDQRAILFEEEMVVVGDV